MILRTCSKNEVDIHVVGAEAVRMWDMAVAQATHALEVGSSDTWQLTYLHVGVKYAEALSRSILKHSDGKIVARQRKAVTSLAHCDRFRNDFSFDAIHKVCLEHRLEVDTLPWEFECLGIPVLDKTFNVRRDHLHKRICFVTGFRRRFPKATSIYTCSQHTMTSRHNFAPWHPLHIGTARKVNI